MEDWRTKDALDEVGEEGLVLLEGSRDEEGFSGFR
jgi:hypothetical protein